MSLIRTLAPFARVRKRRGIFCCPCPFHDTATESLSLFPDLKHFCCKECGRSGTEKDLINLLGEERVADKMCVYVLRLEHGMFYVGLTYQLRKRIAQHYFGKGSEWTKRYPPLELLEVYQQGSHVLENEITMKYIKRYGRGRVRGGNFLSN